jgi:predicted TIM-barrel fold metal-dependent hydrolase
MNQPDWLSQVTEDIIDPERRICDPHHHLWDHPASRYLLDDLLLDTDSGHNIVSTVFVECNSMYRKAGKSILAPIGETEFVQGIAAMSASGRYGNTKVAQGIVSYADLSLGSAVREVLNGHKAASINRFKGIRHAAGWHEDPEIRNSHTNPPARLMLDEKFREGFAVLDEMELSFDAWFYHHQIPEFVDLAKAFPGVTMILDHFGGPLGVGPYNADDVFDGWRDDIAELSDCKNVNFKLGGLNMKINGFNWHKNPQPPTSEELLNRTGRYYEYCIGQFGVDRCMFESNFPVDKDSCSYDILWNMFKKLTASRSEADKNALFHDTASRIYRLESE